MSLPPSYSSDALLVVNTYHHCRDVDFAAHAWFKGDSPLQANQCYSVDHPGLLDTFESMREVAYHAQAQPGFKGVSGAGVGEPSVSQSVSTNKG